MQLFLIWYAPSYMCLIVQLLLGSLLGLELHHHVVCLHEEDDERVKESDSAAGIQMQSELESCEGYWMIPCFLIR